MKELKWGELYAAHLQRDLDPVALESEIKRLLMDDEVQKKSGVWAYVLDGDERHLNLRSFTEAMRIETYERQNGICAETGEHYPIEEMEADHITPWSKGGKTIVENCQMLHKDCNRRKSNK
ncbi:MAG: HNH endonuclease [Cellvibrionales bacterium]|nr:HNH endonuclease [Cellvibrionales bacterium]